MRTDENKTDAPLLLSDNDVIRYSFGIGAFPWVSFGSLGLTEQELAFSPRALLWTPSLACIPTSKIDSARVKPVRSPSRRRLMWILGAILTPPTGLLGLPWLAAFWPKAGSPTLEVAAKPWLFGRTRVYIVENPQEWADAINRLVGERTQLRHAAEAHGQ
jgi:hypothetical protein